MAPKAGGTCAERAAEAGKMVALVGWPVTEEDG
jgi:hypothetical protein